VSRKLWNRDFILLLQANAVRDHYLSTTLLAVTVFLLAAGCQEPKNSRLLRSCCAMGATLSTGIYILHPIWIELLHIAVRVVIPGGALRSALAYFWPFCIFLGSALAAWLLRLLRRAAK